MTMLLSQKNEIFPTKEQKEMLERWLQYCRQTYNSALLDKQRKYKEHQQLYTRSDMQKQQVIDKKRYPFLKAVPSQPLQEVFLRLKKAYDGFLSGDTNYPKLKTYKDYNSLTFPQFGFKSNGKHRFAMSFADNGNLYNKQLGEIEIHLHRPIEGTIKQLILKRQSKRWYTIFSVERQDVPPSIDMENAIGIDVGLNQYAVLSNGTVFENPRFLLQKEKQLRKAQHNLSKKKKDSTNYKKQVERIRSLHEKVANQRKDFLRKLSYHLTQMYSVICIENLDIRKMVRNRKVSKSISDAGWGAFRQMLLYKCEKFGGLLVKVDPAYTSQDCSSCGNRVEKSLSIRTHICTKCGTVLDRDYNASLNILRKGLEQLLVRTTEE
ncbi:transposase [Bacillus pseudomycoides]|uniref:RNA-guided endonuclease InsQ/TnpB family protein n=1 Tax=Bacillus pseudomycoides TaxID=64104 RepID=UPI000BF6E61E|nr:RNA-guided endonuclease TnpB family protein [Bacillus pseudomycoides]PFW97868.1 transposase [Bacillus pseudomycoides]PFX38947.1 transposase [Bacillus pseudomycoides]